eukprot:TRINITY_DN1169_c0_g1_i1.p1 TRINITY_DN1169_c0_g1~~TRINITY_DN1169_c0_g1_i1.p1  ORF type:complete len:252 (+),score=93.59 TRINITY_DN1169_c0_g1_i1:1-756(+)
MENKWKGKVAIVTGASSGLGESIARKYAKEGLIVVLAARRLEKLQQLEKEIKEGGGEALSVQCDVSNKQEVDNLFDVTIQKYKRVDVLVNNAGVMLLSKMSLLKVEEWIKMVDINIKGVLYCIARAIPIMKEQKTGHIITISSDADRKLFTGSAIYSSTKAAVTMITEGVKKELTEEGFTGIRVSSISLGAAMSELTNHITDKSIFEEWSKGPSITPMPSNDVAEVIFMIMNTPQSLNVNNILFRPNDQAF